MSDDALAIRGSRSPRYQTVTEALRRQMGEGKLAAGVKLPPLRELAERFNVSTNTVRNALRVLEREGCLYHVPAVGAFVSPHFPSASATKAFTIAFATLDIGAGFELGIARGIEQACQDRGWGLQVYDARTDVELEKRNLDRLAKNGPHGAIILPTGRPENIEILFQLKLAQFPMVLVDRAITGLQVDLVESDHEGGAYLATEHLVKHGHRRVLMLTEPAGASSIASRIRGYERALLDHGIEPHREWTVRVDPAGSAHGVPVNQRWLGGYEAALPALKRFEPPLAFFTLNDYIGWGLVKACDELGLRIPEDVSIVCFDDSEVTRALTPPLTTIAQRCPELGQRAVERLEQRLQKGLGSNDVEHVRVGVELREGRSVASPVRVS